MRADKQIYHRVRYTMIETSGYHRSIQKSMLAAHENRLRFMTEEEWLAAPPHPGSIVLANELLDAFPVYRLRCDQGTLQEGWVTWDRQAQAFAERWMTQREFMVEHGILDRLQNHTYRDPFSPVARQNRAIRQLLLSNGMGELFKVITAAKV